MSAPPQHAWSASCPAVHGRRGVDHTPPFASRLSKPGPGGEHRLSGHLWGEGDWQAVSARLPSSASMRPPRRPSTWKRSSGATKTFVAGFWPLELDPPPLPPSLLSDPSLDTSVVPG